MKIESENKLPSALTEAHLLAWLEAKVEQLYAEAKLLTNDYWRRWKAEKKKYEPAQHGRIGVRVRRRETTLSFSIEWFRMAMIRQNGQQKSIAQYLKKGAGYSYPLVRMLHGEPEWEAKLVEELETEFADIRKQIDLLGKIRGALITYQKAKQ